MLIRQQRCLVVSQGHFQLTTFEEGLRIADPQSSLLPENHFLDYGPGCKRSLNAMLKIAGLNIELTGSRAQRQEIWSVFCAHVQEIQTTMPKNKKLNDAEKTLPETPEIHRRKNTRTPLECTIHLTEIKPRRKRGAALKRFNLYAEGMTVQAYVDAGGIPWDVWYDSLYGYVTLRNPDGSPFERPSHVAA